MSKPYVLYHADCLDGFAAALAAWRMLGGSANYLPVFYGKPPPTMEEGADVIIVDFSYPKAVLEELGQTRRVLVLDHHRTAEADLREYSLRDKTFKAWDKNAEVGVQAFFDMDHSGAVLSWNFFHGGDAPLLYQMVEDRDLWRFKFAETKAVAAYLQSMPMSFISWYDLEMEMALGGKNLNIIRECGYTILGFKDFQVKEIAKYAKLVEHGGKKYMMVNATLFQSEVGDQLLKAHPDTDFAAMYVCEPDGTTKYSLRARKDGTDVSEVAKKYGGGGHAVAAGFSTKSLIRELCG